MVPASDVGHSHEGRRYIVTGGASGIGAAVSRSLQRCGGHVAILDLASLAADDIPRRGGYGDIVGVAADVSDERSMSEGFEECVRLLGGLDGVHLNAGVSGRAARIADVTSAEFDNVMRINVAGVFLGLQCAYRAAEKLNGDLSIVVTSSVAGLSGSAMYAPYSASKHAVLGLVRTAAVEWAAKGIRVNAVCPGEIHTPMLERAVAEGTRTTATEAAIPLGRVGLAAEVANLVSWLLSEQASYVTGSTVTVDGGLTAGRGVTPG